MLKLKTIPSAQMLGRIAHSKPKIPLSHEGAGCEGMGVYGYLGQWFPVPGEDLGVAEQARF